VAESDVLFGGGGSARGLAAKGAFEAASAKAGREEDEDDEAVTGGPRTPVVITGGKAGLGGPAGKGKSPAGGAPRDVPHRMVSGLLGEGSSTGDGGCVSRLETVSKEEPLGVGVREETQEYPRPS
jgi:hypothetical protein